MKKIILFLSFTIAVALQAQGQPTIDKQEIVRIESTLASDKMQGRAIFSAGIDSASAFIENEFEKIGLDFYKNLQNYWRMLEMKNLQPQATQSYRSETILWLLI